MIDNWEDKLWEIAERYNTSKPVSGDWSTETEHELNAIAEELGISKYSAQYLMISRLGFSEDMFDNSGNNEDSFTTEEAVQEAFPNISEHTVDIISRWYNREGSSEDFSDKEEFAEYIKGDFMNMFWGGDYNDNDFHEVANDMINAGYYDSSDFPYDNEIESSRQIKSSQNGMENVVEGTKYDDYHIDTNGMGILSVGNIIWEIEGRGNQAVLTVQTSDGSTNHSQFSSEDWREYKNSVNDAGNVITDVWVTEVEGGSYVRNSRRPVKSGYKVSPLEWANKWIPEIYDQRKFIQLCEQKGISKIDSDEFFKLMDEFGFKSNGKTFEYDASKYLYNSRKVTSARYIATDPESGEVLGSADTYEEAVNEWGEDVIITDSEATENQEENELFSSKGVIESSKFSPDVIEDVLTSYGINPESFINIDFNINEEDIPAFATTWSGSDPVNIKKVEYDANVDYTVEKLYNDEDEQLFDGAYIVTYNDGHTERYGWYYGGDVLVRLADDEIESSNQLNGDKAFLSNIVSSVLTQRMTQEQAVKRIALRNNCNQAFARNILSSAMEDTSLIGSGTMELASDLNQDFNVDGDFYSWTKDYMPDNGKASTVGGEILRAANQIIHRYQNDGDKINVGNGKETVNPAARYLVDKCVGWTGSSEIEDMLSGANDTNSSDEYYSEWIDDLQVEIEDYLRNHEELFHTANQDDMWDYKTSEDDNVEITSIFIEDDDGNRYSFQGGPEGWHCYDIYYANKPKFNVGDVVSGDEIGNPTDEYTTFEDNGFMYSAEKVEVGDDWEITDVQLEGELVHKDEEWTTDELERYQIYNAENESEISVEDLY